MIFGSGRNWLGHLWLLIRLSRASRRHPEPRFLVMSEIFCNFNKAIARAQGRAQPPEPRFFDGFHAQRGMTGTSWLSNPVIFIKFVDTQASTWMSKVCCGALEINSVPHNPCSPRVWFSARVGEPFNACGGSGTTIRDAFSL